MFNPDAFHDIETIRHELSGSFVLIRNALEPAVAEELYSCLQGSDCWDSEDESIFNGKRRGDYSYNRLTIDMTRATTPEPVRNFYKFLNSRSTLDMMEKISNRTCSHFSGTVAAYREGHYLKSHNDLYSEQKDDGTTLTRSVTFNYMLTKDWNPQMGGQFVWENPLTSVNPEFNSLVMFLVGPYSHHHVTPVTGCGDNIRLAITGWFVTCREANSYSSSLNLDFL